VRSLSLPPPKKIGRGELLRAPNFFPGLALLYFTLLPLSNSLHAADTFNTDICVFGGTSAGIIAAVEAARLGKSVVLLEPGTHLGGMTTGGLGATDVGNPAAIGGLSREFYHRVALHYSRPEAWTEEDKSNYFARRAEHPVPPPDLGASNSVMWTFEPHVAAEVFQEMLTEAGVAVYRKQRLSAIRKSGTRLTEIRMENGNVFSAKMFIDASYEGDLMARAGVTSCIGREANAEYGETFDGTRTNATGHQFWVPVDPFKKPGVPQSGLLPGIRSEKPGTPGEADTRVQAYNYRLCLTDVPSNRLPIAPPPNYNPADYELPARYLEALALAGQSPTLAYFWNASTLPNRKLDVNNNGPFSTDFIGRSWNYPGAAYPARDGIARAHEYYIRGLLTFLATSPRVPVSIHGEIQKWGLCKDEFIENGGWPPQLYVREARRMVSDYVMAEKNCRGTEIVSDSVGLASYNMDSHNCRRIVINGRVENEGDVQVPVPKPYPISYRSLIPKQGQCENLLVPVCLSATHIAYGSIRMEPVFMEMGQAAGTAAGLALDQGVPVQQLGYGVLRARLLAERQILDWTP
jgi:hypothetical protein